MSAADFAHWRPFDETLELAAFVALETALDDGDATAVGIAADRLDALAQSTGYGQADSYLADGRPMPDDYAEGEYWSAIDRSEAYLRARFKDRKAAVASTACDRMRDAFERGAEMRKDAAAD